MRQVTEKDEDKYKRCQSRERNFKAAVKAHEFVDIPEDLKKKPIKKYGNATLYSKASWYESPEWFYLTIGIICSIGMD